MPKIVDHVERREQVALAVLAVIGRTGVEGATLREVAREADCTTGTLSHYFRDKRELLVFAFDLATQRTAERIAARVATLSGLAAARATLEEAAPLDEERRLTSAIWLGFDALAIREPALAEQHRARYRGWREGLAMWLHAAASAGEIPSALDIDLQVDNLTALVLGLGSQALLYPERFPPERQLAMIDTALAALATRAPATPHAAAGA